ncbi:MAG TPA: carboxypeptidase regulatory-like domain-containing protein [Gemmatimonadaceae bacterium]|nr:carboxypeptidase regulatory-like domain-containing protein [Gemmatimonadaceae bacterium]
MIQRLSVALLLSVSVLSGCTGEKTEASAAQPAAARREGSVAPRPAVVSAPSTPYLPTQVADGVTLTGTVDYDGVIPADSVISVPVDQVGCGPTITEHAVDHNGTRIGGVVVWITDIRTGKPLPIPRRFELLNSDCVLNPRLQAVIAPGTLNMSSEDVAMHRNHIIDVATGDLVGLAPFNDNGEVIPFDHLLDKPAELEITCELHPWSKAYILVFDHPYFAMTSSSGAFSIDDVPPGTYHVRAWHPSLGLSDQTVTIVAGQPASLALKLSSAPVSPPPAVPAAAPNG